MTLENKINNIKPFEITEKEINIGGVKTFLLKQIRISNGGKRTVLYNANGYKVSETLFNGDSLGYTRENGNLITRHYNPQSKKLNVISQPIYEDKQYCWRNDSGINPQKYLCS